MVECHQLICIKNVQHPRLHCVYHKLAIADTVPVVSVKTVGYDESYYLTLYQNKIIFNSVIKVEIKSFMNVIFANLQ